MPRRRGGGSGGTPWEQPLRLVGWALALLAIGSAFAPLPRDFLRIFHWVLFLFAILEAGIALGTGRRGSFFAYAAIAMLVNPLRPFVFALQMWRLIHAGIGIWIASDHIPGRG